jgi:hypothetical protein
VEVTGGEVASWEGCCKQSKQAQLEGGVKGR